MKYRIIYLMLVIGLATLSACHVGRYFYWNFAGQNDVDKFPTNPIKKNAAAFYFKKPTESFDFQNLKSEALTTSLIEDIESNGTVAFLIIKNDTLLMEKYFHGYNDSTLLTSFSMAKSMISALLGTAIGEGKITSTDQTIGDYLDFIKDEEVKSVTIENLLNMTSGIKYNEGYFNPFGDVAKSYYGLHLKRYMTRLKMADEQGTKFKYVSANTQLLALIIEAATGQSINEYAEKKLWQPMQTEFDGSWSVDSRAENTEKAFCCWNARARDYAKLGRLYLNKGNWEGRQLVPEEWVKKSTSPQAYGIRPYYSYQWWHNVQHTSKTNGKTYVGTELFKLFLNGSFGDTTKFELTPFNDFYAQGIIGQFIYVNPASKVIIVRIGKKRGKLNWSKLFYDISNQV